MKRRGDGTVGRDNSGWQILIAALHAEHGGVVRNRCCQHLDVIDKVIELSAGRRMPAN